MKKVTSTYLFVVFLFAFVTPLTAQQSIEANAEKNEIMLGEPLQVTVSVTGSQQYTPVIPDTLGHFEVLEKKPITTKNTNGNVVTQQQIVVTSFDSGIQRIPPIAIDGNPNIVSAGVDITVKTLPADAKTKYGDIKQIISLEPPDQWPYIAILGLATLLSAWGIYHLNRKRMIMQEIIETAEPVETAPPGRLQQQMETLRTEWQAGRISSAMLGNQLMEIFRKYLSGKGIYATSKTGEELVFATKNLYPAGQWQQIVQTIRLCNAMRFGKYNAGVAEGNQGIDAFAAAITKTDLKPATI